MGASRSLSSILSPATLRAFRRRLGGRTFFAFGYFVAFVLWAATVIMSAKAPGQGPLAPTRQILLALLVPNLLLIAFLAGAQGWSIVGLVQAQARDAGARLHLKFVGMFSLAAFLPAVVVLVFFGALVTRGVDNWFSKRVSTVVENSATVARSSFNEKINTLQGDLLAMATDLNRDGPPLLRSSPITFGRLLEGQAANRDLIAAYVIDHEGRILASAESDDAPPFVAPPARSLREVDDGSIGVKTFERADLIRALYRMKAFDDAYLYVARPVEPEVFGNLSSTLAAITAYREAAANRQQIQGVFILTYVETVLLVLVGAAWLGMTAASAISGPVSRLVAAAHRVAGGDLTARVDAEGDPEEIAVLSHAFNKMTRDLQIQQMALRAASLEAESRREFIETVLAGVSAGVLGLDAQGRVSASNRQARLLLDLKGEALGRPLQQVAPEMLEVASGGGRSDEAEIDLVRGGDTRRLRVRASSTAEGGLVLTFDDITRLVTAQRSAAWRDVARRIAHEIKNPLTPIQLSAERLRRKYRKEIASDLETFDRCTETIIRQVGDIGRMVDEFSAFARMPAPKFEVNNASELLRQAVFAQRVADPETVIELEEPGRDVGLMCDGRMVGQALTNILKNAGEAVAGRRQARPGLKGRIIARLVRDAAGLAFEVEDNGVGLPARNREQLTEPYVTTREKGTGLGLAIVKRILEEHGGELALMDASDLPGARAVLRFPESAIVELAAPAGAVAE
jgi:two-component system nitrogen regulation sensor histidine kinase NtrY